MCQRYQPKNQKEPLLPHELPKRAWEKVDTDLLEFSGKTYIVIVDYYSKWIELLQMNRKTAEEVIQKLKDIFFKTRESKAIDIEDGMLFTKNRLIVP